MSKRLLTSADIEDGKIEYDPATNASIQYKVIEGGYEVHTTTPQPNGTIKTQVRTFFDPKPCSEEDLKTEAINKKLLKSRLNKEIRIDKNTTMLTRAIEGGYEEVYTTVHDDGTRSMRTKTFFDSVPADVGYDNLNTQQVAEKPKSKKQQQITRKASVESTDSTESRKVVSKKNLKQESTYEESHRVTENVEYTEDNRTVRKNSVQEQNIKAISHSSNTSDNKDTKKQSKKKGKSSIPPPPPEFIENDTTTVASKRVPGGVEYTYSTTLESGKTITTTKTIYEEEESELTEEEIRVYKKTLKDAEKHKNVAAPKKLRSESGTKKVVPSENPGDVTTVETIKIEGGTEFHYTTVTSEGIVKKAVKTVYDAVPCKVNPDDTDEEEIIEEYEEEIIEPGEKNIRTIETIKQLPTKFEEEVTITHEKKEKKVKKSMVISH